MSTKFRSPLRFDTLEERTTPAVTTTLVSVALPTFAGNAISTPTTSPGASFSADGNLVVFSSEASNLVAGDTNGVSDVFVANLTTGVVTRLSVDGEGVQANGPSLFPSISADGKFVAFQSSATNLVSTPLEESTYIYVKDLDSGVVTLVSAKQDGTPANNFSFLPAISANGQFVVFSTYAFNLNANDTDAIVDIYRKDLQTGAIALVSTAADGVTKGNLDSQNAAISADGVYVVFATQADNLLPGGLDANDRTDVFRKNMNTQAIDLVSADSLGTPGNGDSVLPVVSADGSTVAFQSTASNLVEGDTNGVSDVFVKTLADGAIRRVSVSTTGAQLTAGSQSPTISDDGTRVTFVTAAAAAPADTNTVADVYLFDAGDDSVVRLTQHADGSDVYDGGDLGRISGDASLLVFLTAAGDLTAGDNNGSGDVYVLDRMDDSFTLVSHGSEAIIGGNNDSVVIPGAPQVGRDGQSVVFISFASNLVPGIDANGPNADVYLRLVSLGVTLRISQSEAGVQGNGDSFTSSVDTGALLGDGGLIAFSNSSTNLVPGGSNGAEQIYLVEPTTGTIALMSQLEGVLGDDDSYNPVLSANGRYLAFLTYATNLFDDQTPGSVDAVVLDLFTNQYSIVSADSLGNQVPGTITGLSISADGRYIAFASDADGLVEGDTNGLLDVFVKDMSNGELVLVSRGAGGEIGDGQSYDPVISEDGRFIAFASNSSNLVEGDTNSIDDIFRSEWQAGDFGTIVRASVTAGGVQTNAISRYVSISDDGRFVAFASGSDNLAEGDDNEAADVFVKDLNTGTLFLASQSSSGQIGNGASVQPSLSPDGRSVAYYSLATNLSAADVNDFADVFLTVINAEPDVVIAGATTIIEGATLSLNAAGTTDPEEDPLAFSWDLNGDGTFDDAVGAVIDLTPLQLAALGISDGPLTVEATLRVTDAFGPTFRTFTITIQNAPPVAHLELVAIGGFEGGTGAFVASATDPSPEDESLGFTYSWTVTRDGDSVASGNGTDVQFDLDDNGLYQVTLTVTDHDLATHTISSATYLVANVAPTLVALNSPATGAEGTAIAFTPTATDPGLIDTIAGLGFVWTVTKNGDFYTQNSGDSVSFLPDDDGTYVVEVHAVDKDGGESEPLTATIVVANVDPTLVLAPTGIASEGSLYTLAFSAIDPGADSIVTWVVNWGDGSPEETFAGNLTQATHVYADGAQTWTITVTATDDDDVTVSSTQNVTVADVPPTVAITGGNGGIVGTPYTITLGALVDPGADTVISLSVDWGDGVIETLAPNGFGLSYAHTYALAGIREITVIVENEDGTFDAGTKTIQVLAVPPTIALTGDDAIDEGAEFTLGLGAISDLGEEIVTGYSIDWGDGNVESFSGNPASTTRTHVYDDGDAAYVIRVGLVVDGDVEIPDAGSFSLSIVNVTPTISLTGNDSVDEGSPYTLTLGSVVDPGDDTATGYSIAWGDGSVETFTGSPNGVVHTHTYIDGTDSRTITVSITDEDGTFSAGTKTIAVDNVAPTVSLNGSASIDEGAAYTLTLGSVVDPGDDTATGYSVAWGDGEVETFTGSPNGVVHTHTYVDGTASRTISVSVTDEDGTFQAGTKTITVDNAAPTLSLIGSDSVNEGAAYTLTLGSVVDPGTDAVTGYSIAWGDGSVENFPGNPNGAVHTHTYADGTAPRTILVSVTDEDGTFEAGTKTVSVENVAPAISLTGNDTVDQGVPYTLTLGSVVDPGTDTVTGYSIAWGDGSVQSFTGSPNGAVHTHAYAVASASRTIVVTITDEDGDFSAGTKTIEVLSVEPVIELIGNDTVAEGSAYTLTINAITNLDTVTGYTIAWGDGSTETYTGSPAGAVRTHTYADGTSARTIVVSLTDAEGTFEAASKTITIGNVAPTVELTGAAAIDEGSTYSLTLGNVVDPGTDTVTGYSINWGDGVTETFSGSPNGAVHTHVFADGAQTRTISVSLTDEDGTFAAAGSKTVTVDNVAPTISLSGDNFVVVDSPYTLTLGPVVDPGTDAIAEYTIDWGDGTVETFTGSPASAVRTHTYTTAAVVRTISVSLTDEDGAFPAAGTKTITVNGDGPTIALTGSDNVNEGSVYTLNLGALSNLGDAVITGYTIEWGDGASETFEGNPANSVKTHTYADGAAGRSIVVTLREGQTEYPNAGSKAVTVDNVAPIIALTGDSSVNEGSVYTLNLGAITDPGTDTVTAYSIDWGDGTVETLTGNPAGATRTHTYADGDASRTITVSLTDEDGTFSSAGTLTINVVNVAPTIALSGNANVVVDTTYTLTLGAITDPGVDTVTGYSVDWGDGTVETFTGSPANATRTHTYTSGGVVRTILVSLTDEDGAFPSVGSKTVTVNNASPTIALAGNANANEGAVYTLTLGALANVENVTITGYVVDWGDGTVETFSGNPADTTRTHTYADGAASRTISVTLQANSESFPNAGTKAVVIDNVAPTVVLSGNDSVNEGTLYTLTFGSVVDPGAETIASYTIDWGDGTVETLTGNPSVISRTHTYADGPATRSIVVSLTDEDGTFASAGTKTVTVANVAPTITLSGNATTIVNAVYTLTLGAVTDPGTDTITAYSVDWGDGTVETFTGSPASTTKTHTYTTAVASRTITVSVTDEDGTSSAGTKTIAVNAITLLLTSNTVSEKAAAGTAIGSVNVSDAAIDVGATLTLINDAGGRFVLNGRSLAVAPGANLDFETATSHVVRVRAVNGSLTYEQDLTIQVLDADEGDDFVGRDPVTGELYVARSTGSRFVTTNYQGVFDPSRTWVDYLVADFTDDGFDDVMARDKATGEWFLAKNEGDRFTVALWEDWNQFVTWVDVFAVDLNNDGKFDILARELEMGQWWCSFSQGTTGFAELIGRWDVTKTWVDTAIGDFDKDGRIDLLGRLAGTGQLWASMNVFTTEFSGKAKFVNQLESWATLSDGNSAAATTWLDVQVGDVNGDGFLDVLGRVEKTGHWYVAMGTAGKPKPSTFWTAWNPFANWDHVQLGDVNGDGRADLVGHAHDQWWVGLSPTIANGTVSNPMWGGLAGYDYAGDWFLGDFNRDGKIDVAGLRSFDLGWQVGLSTGTDFSFSIWDAWPSAPARDGVSRGKIVN